jgi:hypothetical protein
LAADESREISRESVGEELLVDGHDGAPPRVVGADTRIYRDMPMQRRVLLTQPEPIWALLIAKGE